MPYAAVGRPWRAACSTEECGPCKTAPTINGIYQLIIVGPMILVDLVDLVGVGMISRTNGRPERPKQIATLMECDRVAEAVRRAAEAVPRAANLYREPAPRY